MQKHFVMILILMMIMTPAAADAQGAASDEAALFKQALGFAQAGNRLFVSTATGIYVVDEGDVALATADVPNGQLMSDGNRLYVLDHNAGALTHWAWEDGRLHAAEVYPLDWRAVGEGADGRIVVGAAMTPGYVYLLLEGTDALANDLLIFDLKSGLCHRQTATNAHAITAYWQDRILMACYDFASTPTDCEIKIYDAVERAVAPYAKDIGISPVCLFYDSIEDSLFLESNGVVYALADGSLRMVANLSGVNLSSNRSACKMGDLYITQDMEQGAVAIRLRMEGMEPKILHFAGHRSIDAQFNPAFSQAHPEVMIQYREDSVSTDYVRAISPIGKAQLSPDFNEPIADSNWSSEKEALLEEIEQCRTDMEDADAVEKADMQAYIDMLNQYISEKEADPWLASAEEIAAYRDVAEHMHFAEHSAYLGYAQQSAYDELVGIGLQYVEGKLTQAAFIERMNQAAYMRFTEGQ